ncbi:MAG: hypothetical protein ACTSQP_24020 [Promethearchaeota archaeon]
MNWINNFYYNNDDDNNMTHFEKLIEALSIKEGKKEYLKNQIHYIFKNLKKISRWKSNHSNITIRKISNKVEIIKFWYGGSWDRGVYINKEFDIDIYFIYKENEAVIYKLNQEDLSGKILFEILTEDLLTFKNEINPKLIIKKPPYSHSISIKLEYQNRFLKVDCIPAIELSNQFLLVPDGWDKVKKVNLKLEEKGLSKVNKKTNGKATKLIRLLKYWNWSWNKPLKSYIIQRLVEEIFLESRINSWGSAIKTFFNRAINIFNKYFDNILVLKDRVYQNRSILDEYSEDKINEFYEAIRNANNLARKSEWKELFYGF